MSRLYLHLPKQAISLQGFRCFLFRIDDYYPTPRYGIVVEPSPWYGDHRVRRSLAAKGALRAHGYPLFHPPRF